MIGIVGEFGGELEFISSSVSVREVTGSSTSCGGEDRPEEEVSFDS